MTDETDTTEPDAFDPLDALTLAELDGGSRLLKASIVRAIAEKTQDYERALGVLAYLHARRTDRTTPPEQLLKTYSAMRFTELTAYLDSLAPVDGSGGDADPTEPVPA